MKITHMDLKKGIARVVPLNKDDLWVLGQVINQGAFVSGKTTRKVKLSETKVEKKTIFLEIATEKVDFTNEALRISGKVVSEKDDVPKGSYHSFSVDVHDEITIKQKWLRFQIDKLEEATKEKSSILLVALDRENVFFAKIANEGYTILSSFQGDVEKKTDGVKAKGGFYKEIEVKLKEYDERLKLNKIVLASPAFFKEDFMKQLQDESLRKKIILATCSSVSDNAFSELLKRQELKEALDKERIQEEVNAVENLFVEIKREGKFAYGIDEVRQKTEQGAVQLLLVTGDLISKYREDEKFQELEEIMNLVEQSKGKIIIINSKNEAGKKLDGITGIGAILRY